MLPGLPPGPAHCWPAPGPLALGRLKLLLVRPGSSSSKGMACSGKAQAGLAAWWAVMPGHMLLMCGAEWCCVVRRCGSGRASAQPSGCMLSTAARCCNLLADAVCSGPALHACAPPSHRQQQLQQLHACMCAQLHLHACAHPPAAAGPAGPRMLVSTAAAHPHACMHACMRPTHLQQQVQ